jgi:Spy/CpxP family protein refolding chaperone
LPPLWSRLGLAREQKDRIYAIRADYRPKIEELRQQIRALEKKQMADLQELLTPAQKARLKELADEQREKTGKPDKKASPEAEKPAEKRP